MVFQVPFVDSQILEEGKGVFQPGFLQGFEPFEFLSEFRFDQSRDVLRPLPVFQLLVIVEVEVVELSVVEFGVEDLSDQLVDVPHLSENVLLEHPEAFGGMEYLEGSHPPEQLH